MMLITILVFHGSFSRFYVILGAIFSFIYINDLPKLATIGTKILLYADDTTIIVPSPNLQNFETQIDKIFGDINHHHISIMELGHLLTRSGLTYPKVSSKVCNDSFCQLENSVSLPWVIYYEAFYLHVVSSFSCTPVICPKLVLFLIPL